MNPILKIQAIMKQYLDFFFKTFTFFFLNSIKQSEGSKNRQTENNSNDHSSKREKLRK